MPDQQERRTSKNRREHKVKLPRAFERRRKAEDPRKPGMVIDTLSDSSLEKSEAYWGA